MIEDSEIRFSNEELARYSRHLIIPEFNIEGQRKLKSSKVLVVGSGGLGSPLLLYLAAAGIGKIGIVDFDVVDESNLQRQVLFGVPELGKPKVEAARDRILALNPHIEVVTYNTRLTSENALEIIREYDIVADGTDNFPTRYLVNDACVLLDKPNVYASIFRFDGQVSVFNHKDENGINGPNYRDLYSEPPPPGMVPSCAEGGVLGVLPGIIGSLQASEVLKVITGIGEVLSGRLFLFDALSFTAKVLRFSKDPDNPLSGDNPSQSGLIDYEEFCGINGQEAEVEVDEISPREFEQMRRTNPDLVLVDVREAFEYEIVNLGGKLIPTAAVLANREEIPREGDVVVYCRSGIRSRKAINELKKHYGYKNLLSLRGGIIAYAEEVDPSLPTY